MKPRELFGVAIRSMGVWIVANVVLSILNLTTTPGAVYGILGHFAIGAILFTQADAIVRMAYGKAEKTDDTDWR